MSRRVRLTAVSAGIGVAVVLLMVTAIRAAGVYYYTLPQFRALGSAAVGRFVKVNGTIAPQGLTWDAATQTLRFVVLPPKPTPGEAAPPSTGPAAPLPVVFHGPEPSTFAPGIGVVVVGRLAASGVFDAQQVLVKCPSTYVAASST